MALLVVSMVHLDHDNYDDAICLNQRLVNMVGCNMVQKLLARGKSEELATSLLIAKFLQRRQQKAAEKRNIVKLLLAREKSKGIEAADTQKASSGSWSEAKSTFKGKVDAAEEDARATQGNAESKSKTGSGSNVKSFDCE